MKEHNITMQKWFLMALSDYLLRLFFFHWAIFTLFSHECLSSVISGSKFSPTLALFKTVPLLSCSFQKLFFSSSLFLCLMQTHAHTQKTTVQICVWCNTIWFCKSLKFRSVNVQNRGCCSIINMNSWEMWHCCKMVTKQTPGIDLLMKRTQ